MANFVAVPAEAIEEFLQSKKFVRSVQRNEVVYSRTSVRHPDVHIKVYTSVKQGQDQVRAAGKDAIRVCVVFDNGRKSFGVGKFPPVLRVHSVESVLGRLWQRLQQASTRGNEWIDQSKSQNQNFYPQQSIPNSNELEEKLADSESYKEFLSAIGEPVNTNKSTDPEVALEAAEGI